MVFFFTFLFFDLTLLDRRCMYYRLLMRGPVSFFMIPIHSFYMFIKLCF